VGNRKVEFDSESSPCTAIGNRRLLNGWVRVKHRLAADLVGARVNVPSQIGQYGTLQVFIFQKHRTPDMVGASIRQVVAKCVRIVEAAVCILIEWRIEIRCALLISR